jgi:hypothetical protein
MKLVRAARCPGRAAVMYSTKAAGGGVTEPPTVL